MAAEFRQRSVGEFWQMIRRRLWLIVLPTIAIGIAVGWVVWKLPDMYESKTSLAIKPATISPDVVKAVTEEELSQSLQAMNQEIQSRSSLEAIITKYGLFEAEKSSGMDMGLIVDKMRSYIKIEPERADNDKWTGFKLLYRDRTPTAARNVAADLAGKYVNAQASRVLVMGEKTSEFIEKQLNEKKSILLQIEQERQMIMMQNSSALPEGSGELIAQLTSLRQREETLSKEKDTLVVEKGRNQQSIQSINSQINMAESFGREDIENNKKGTRIEDIPAYGDMLKLRASLTAKLANLKKEYTEKHPDVIETQTQIDKVNEEIEGLQKNLNNRATIDAKRGNTQVEKQKAALEIDKKKYEDQITLYDQQIAAKEEESRQNAGNIAQIEARLNQVPSVRAALEGVNNKYKTAQTEYDELSKQLGASRIQIASNNDQQGESIKVVDFANLPVAPVNATKKPLFILVGAGLGLALGLFLAALFEVPRLLKIQNIEDAKHYTGLPVLASVPPLLTNSEKTWQKRSHWMKVLVGIVIAFGSIPVIIMLLQATRLFERLVS